MAKYLAYQNVVLALVFMVTIVASDTSTYAAAAPEWKPLPLACLPGRAQKWQAGLTEPQQATCHCPDTTQTAFACPPEGNYPNLAAFYAATNLPSPIASRCCELPVCPPNSILAGQSLPADGNCNPQVNTTSAVTRDLANVSGRACIELFNEDLQVGRSAPNCSGFDPVLSGGNGDCIGADTKLVKADGSLTLISKLQVGQKISGLDGDVVVTRINRLQEKAPLFYRVNNTLVITGEHPILTTAGWKMIDPEVDAQGKLAPRLEIGDMLKTKGTPVKVTSIEVVKGKAPDAYNIGTAGGVPFIADGITIKPFKAIKFTY